MHVFIKSVLATAAVVASIAASAQPFARIDTQEIDARQARQEARIERGIARGEITRWEARTLLQGQRQIARFEAHAKADGRVTREEMRQLTAMLDQADAQIRELRHDRNGRHPT
jgi:hypothetical protein